MNLKKTIFAISVLFSSLSFSLASQRYRDQNDEITPETIQQLDHKQCLLPIRYSIKNEYESIENLEGYFKTKFSKLNHKISITDQAKVVLNFLTECFSYSTNIEYGIFSHNDFSLTTSSCSNNNIACAYTPLVIIGSSLVQQMLISEENNFQLNLKELKNLSLQRHYNYFELVVIMSIKVPKPLTEKTESNDLTDLPIRLMYDGLDCGWVYLMFNKIKKLDCCVDLTDRVKFLLKERNNGDTHMILKKLIQDFLHNFHDPAMRLFNAKLIPCTRSTGVNQ